MAKVLYVEDEVLIAMDGEAMLRDMGFESIVVAYSLPDAERAIAANNFDFALMDINLGDGQTSLRIADQLNERGTPIVFTSGYNCSEGLVAHLDVPLIEKPFDESVLRHAVFKALEARFAGQAAQPSHTRNSPMSPGRPSG